MKCHIRYFNEEPVKSAIYPLNDENLEPERVGHVLRYLRLPS